MTLTPALPRGRGEFQRFRNLTQEFFGLVQNELILDTEHLEAERPLHRITRRILHPARLKKDGKPDWEIAVVAGLRGAVCFALDLAYVSDPRAKVFKFGPPREVPVDFLLPAYLRPPVEVLRMDAEGSRAVAFTTTTNGIRFTASCGPVNIFVASPRAGLVDELKAPRQSLIDFEGCFGFDPDHNAEGLEKMRRLVRPRGPKKMLRPSNRSDRFRYSWAISSPFQGQCRIRFCASSQV